MEVTDVDHRDDQQFYGWLADRYRLGEVALVDAALRRCSAKAEDRTSTPRVLAWLAHVTGERPDPAVDADESLALLAAIARTRSAENAAIIAALSATWPLLDTGTATLVAAAQPDGTRSLAPEIVTGRLAAALDLLANEPDFDLLLRADDFASEIERHFAHLANKAERDGAVIKALAALRDLSPEDLQGFDADAIGTMDEADLRAIVRVAEDVSAARATLVETQSAWRDASDAPKSVRRAAEDARRDAEDALEEAGDHLRLVLNGAADQPEPDGEKGSVPAADAVAAEVPEPRENALAPVVALGVTDVEEASPSVDEPMEAALAFGRADDGLAENVWPEPADDAPNAVSGQQEEAKPATASENEPSFDRVDIEPTTVVENDTPPFPAAKWDRWIATALASERVGLAVHLATARDLAGGDGSGLPVAVLAGTLHGRATRAAYDGGWHRYEALRDPLIEQAKASGPLPSDQAALDVLDALEGDTAAQFNSLKRMLADLRGTGVRSVSDIAAPAGADERRRRAAGARQVLEGWLRDAPARRINYQPATLLWQSLVARDGAIGSVVAGALADEDTARDSVPALIGVLTDSHAAEALILQADEARSGRGRHNSIEGAALRQLRNFCGGVADLLGDWLREGGEVPEVGDRHRARRAALLRELRSARALAIAAAPFGTAMAVASGLFATTVDALIAELEGRPDPSTAWSQDDELALLPAFPLNARREIAMEPDDAPALADAAERALGAGLAPTAEEAFADAITRQNASAAKRLLAHLPDVARSSAAIDLDRMVARAGSQVTERARDLRQRLDDLQIALIEADQLPDAIERDMSAFEQAAVDQLPLDAAERGDMADFPAAHRRLDAIEARLAAARAPVAQRLDQAVAEQEARHGRRLDECRSLLAQGDLGTLAESIAQIKRHGLSLSQTESSVELLRRFGTAADALGERPSLDLVQLQRVAREGGMAAPFDFARLSQTDRARAEQVLASWKDLRRAAAPGFKGDVNAGMRTAVIGLMSAIGFTGVRVEQVQRERTLFRLTVATDPLRSRERCLAPAFGSDANGRYAVVVVPDDEVRSALNLFDKLPEQVLLAALGITFDQPVDASHMLSLVGFYPSLMQSFGKAVVDAVDTRLKQPGDGVAMPFGVDRGLIGDCFSRQEFRAGVVERFQKTLQLDERYELITYAVWQQALQDAREGKPTARGGYPASEIRKQADFWWAAGFRDTDSPDSFAAILDEMVEMGVLAREGERYSLRSQRIAAMLGSEAEIGDRLESFSERAPKRRADPMTSHRRIGGLWSPMSLRQEAVLAERLARADDPTSVVLVGASPATGAEDVSAALGTLADKLQWPVPRGLSTLEASVIMDVVRSVKPDAKPGRPKLVIVGDGWPSPDTLAALRRHRMLRDPQQPVRVIFHGPPRADLLKLEDGPDWLRLMLRPLPLEAMVHWMNREGLSFAGQEDVQRALRVATGGLIHLLDSIKRPPPAERQDAERLLARAQATALSPEDLGLDGTLAAFARALREDIGDGAFTNRELKDWAAEQDPENGPDRLRVLRALGVVEPVTGIEEGRLHALNPAAFRTLA